jgi:hypothetical protein
MVKHGPVSGNAFVQTQALPDVKATKKILKIKSKPTRREGTLPKIKSVRKLKCKNPLQTKTTAWSCEGKVTLSNVAFTNKFFWVFALLSSTGFTTSISFLPNSSKVYKHPIKAPYSTL